MADEDVLGGGGGDDGAGWDGDEGGAMGDETGAGAALEDTRFLYIVVEDTALFESFTYTIISWNWYVTVSTAVAVVVTMAASAAHEGSARFG